MTRDERRHRIPTSDELEQQGALRPVAANPDKRGGLLKFFRVSRFRVSDDVATRRRVDGAQNQTPETVRRGESAPRAAAPDRSHTGASIRSAEPIVPRKIRIDPSVKERRGLGGHEQ